MTRTHNIQDLFGIYLRNFGPATYNILVCLFEIKNTSAPADIFEFVAMIKYVCAALCRKKKRRH